MVIIQKLLSWWGWYTQSGLDKTFLPIPMVETLLLFVLLSICLLFRFSRIGLLVAYAFVYRWAWMSRALFLPDEQAAYNVFTTAYIVFGILVLTFVIIGMLNPKESR